jgi:5-methylcytosine-specific restriction endonuclease McrA
MLADILTEDNRKEVLKETCCKSKRQLEEIVSRYKPGKDINDRVRTIFVKTSPGATAATSKSSTPDDSNSQDSRHPNWGKFTTAGGGEKSAASITPGPCTSASTPPQNTVLKKKYKLEFTVEPECMQKVEEVKAILSRKYPEGVPLGKLLEEMADEYLEKHSPERKRKRREKRRAKQKEKEKCNRHKNSKRSRHIPQALQDEVYARDEGRCTFVGPNGVRCNSTWNLEIDHIKPYAKGGKHSIRNLRLLCAKHNNHEAERSYGGQFIKRRIYEAKSIKK